MMHNLISTHFAVDVAKMALVDLHYRENLPHEEERRHETNSS